MAFSFFSTGTTSEVNFIPQVFSKLLQSKFYSASFSQQSPTLTTRAKSQVKVTRSSSAQYPL